MRHEPGHVPASNALSETISRGLKKRGMKYLGSVTVYAHLQAGGIINDHQKNCDRCRRLIERYPVKYIEETNLSDWI